MRHMRARIEHRISAAMLLHNELEFLRGWVCASEVKQALSSDFEQTSESVNVDDNSFENRGPI